MIAKYLLIRFKSGQIKIGALWVEKSINKKATADLPPQSENATHSQNRLWVDSSGAMKYSHNNTGWNLSKINWFN